MANLTKKITDLESALSAARTALTERDAMVGKQRHEIELLRYHLKRCRDNAFQTWHATSGILPKSHEVKT